MSFSYGDNSSPNILLIVAGIALVAFFAWKFFFNNPTGFGVKLSTLPTNFQTLITAGFSRYFGNTFPLSYNGGSVNFTISQIPSGTDFQGIVFSSSDGSVNVYINYYELFNWVFTSTDAMHLSVLSVPSRTLANGTITDNATGGYSITGTGAMNYSIQTLTGPVTAGLVSSTGTSVSIASLPTPPAA